MTPENPAPGLLHHLVWRNDLGGLEAAIDKYRADETRDPENGFVSFIDSKYRGTTALGLAAQLGHKECVAILLRHWADTLESSDIGYYPLQEATSLGDREIMRMILLRRHEQLRQLWKVRQPSLAAALHSDLPDFFLEMDWHFRSWVPFLARLCPSDTCRVWKHKNKLRVDSSLMGVELENLNWVKGNVSFIFHVNEQDSLMMAIDHDKKIYEEIDKMQEFTEEEIEEDLTLRLNSQIYSGKIRKPRDSTGQKRVVFTRQQGGLFGMGGDKEEDIGPYQTKVYNVPGVEAIGKYRKEHLLVREESRQDPKRPSSVISEHQSNADSLESEKVLADLGTMEPQVEGLIQDATKDLYVYAPSLQRPKLPLVTETEYFPAKISSLPYMHAGRRMVQSEKSKKFHLSVWMADNFPLTVRQLMPFFEIMTQGNKNFEKLQEFISMDLPPGFPVRIEIPLFAFLAAQITFGHFLKWEQGVPKPQFAQLNENWFEVPKDYKRGIVIKNILKDN